MLDDIIRRIKSNKRGKETETSANTKWSGVNSIRIDKERRKKEKCTNNSKGERERRWKSISFSWGDKKLIECRFIFFIDEQKKKLYTPSNVVVSGCVYTSGTIERR